MSLFRVVVLLLAIVATPPTRAVAQSNHLASSKIELGSWVLHPIYSVAPGGDVSVSHFLATFSPTSLSGSNLGAVWFFREGEHWAAKSWDSSDVQVAVDYLKRELALPDSEDGRWGLDLSEEFVEGEGVHPEHYVGGLMASDPLAPMVAASPDRDSIVAVLVAMG